MDVHLNNKFLFKTSHLSALQEKLKDVGLNSSKDYYILCNGKRVFEDEIGENSRIHIVPRLCGGKGGFGSMLRAIGAQIEKTTNREACRDLSGRRLRDINEEQRLKNWISSQAEREKEAAARKQKKLEKLCEEPKHEFKDESYDQLRSELPDRVEDAVTQGLKASASCGQKRKQKVDKKTAKQKKAKLWFDEEELSDSDEEEEEQGAESSSESSSSTESKEKVLSTTNKIEESCKEIDATKEIEIDKTKISSIN